MANFTDSPRVEHDSKIEHDYRIGRIKTPKKVLHFSDGTLEEYSTDDEVDSSNKENTISTVDPKTLSWGPWIWYYTATAGTKTLEVCDSLGEHLADFFGITSPKYQYEIDEYNRIMAEEEERKKRQDLEMGGWSGESTAEGITEHPVTNSITPSSSKSELQSLNDNAQRY